MRGRTIKNSGIRTRITFLAVAPLISITLIIGYYLTTSRLDEVRRSLDERGHALVKHLALSSEFALFAGNVALIRLLADATLREADVQSVTILDAKNHIVARVRSKQIGSANALTLGGITAQENSLVFAASVLPSGIAASDYEKEFSEGLAVAAAAQPAAAIGRVEIKMSLTSTLARQWEILANSLYIMAGGLLISVLLAYSIGKGLIDPLMRLKTVVRMLREGSLAARVHVLSGGELGELEADVNEMASTIENSQTALQRGIREATSDLHETVRVIQGKNVELESLRHEAMKANRAKAEFLAKMSHEIRTPLSAVVGFSKLLEKSAQTQEQVEYTRTISRAADQLLTVIDDILDFSRIESGEVRLEQIPFDPKDWIEDVIAMLSVAAHAKGLDLVLLFHSDIPRMVVGDPVRMSQVITNLASNAIKFTATGHVVVEIESVTSVDAICHLKISVADSGIGISEQQQRDLFEMFAQADSSIVRRFGGSGLGLAISKRLVKLMGGEIGVRSAPVHGSTFFFTMACGYHTGERRAVYGRSLFQKKILIYDAHPFARRSMRNLALSWGMEVFNTGDCSKLVGLLAQVQDSGIPCQLLILGLSREEMESADLLTLIADVRGEYAGPILLLVGVVAWDLPPQLQSRGRIRWLSKPARRETVYDNCCDLLDIAREFDRLDTGPEKSAAAGIDHPYAGLRVLIAEDNDFNRDLLVNLLQGWGATVDAVTNGGEAVEKARSADYDVIFMDIHMPLMDGIEAGGRIRMQCEWAASVPIIALTADVFLDRSGSAAQHALDDFLIKPITEEKLSAVIRKWIPRARFAGLTALHETVSGLSIEVPCKPDPLTTEIRQKLIADVRRLWDALSSARLANDRDATRNNAHQLQGVSGYFGVPGLARAAQDLERAVLQGGLGDVDSCMRDLEHHIQGVIGEDGEAEK